MIPMFLPELCKKDPIEAARRRDPDFARDSGKCSEVIGIRLAMSSFCELAQTSPRLTSDV